MADKQIIMALCIYSVPHSSSTYSGPVMSAPVLEAQTVPGHVLCVENTDRSETAT